MSSNTAQTGKGANPPAPAEKKNKKRMTQEQIDRLIRYETHYFPEDAMPKVSEVWLTGTNQADQGNLPVPLDQIDDYIANIFREINKMEARFMRERARILNDYYTKGYAMEEEEEVTATPATTAGRGRRRFRAGVTKQQDGKTKMLN